MVFSVLKIIFLIAVGNDGKKFQSPLATVFNILKVVTNGKGEALGES